MIYNKPKDGLTKNYHFYSMLKVAKQRNGLSLWNARP